jgi:hypothetical protein
MPTVSPVALPGDYIEVDIIIHSVAEWITSKKKRRSSGRRGSQKHLQGRSCNGYWVTLYG